MLPSLTSLLCAVVASFVVGMLWYSPLMFGNVWVKLKQFDKKNFKAAQKNMGFGYLLSLLGTIIQTLVLYQILYVYNVKDIGQAACVTIMVWLGFIAVTQLTMMVFDTKKFNLQLFVIDTSYQLTSLLFIAVLLTLLNS